jgi:hypothetical protein
VLQALTLSNKLTARIHSNNNNSQPSRHVPFPPTSQLPVPVPAKLQLLFCASFRLQVQVKSGQAESSQAPRFKFPLSSPPICVFLRLHSSSNSNSSSNPSSYFSRPRACIRPSTSLTKLNRPQDGPYLWISFPARRISDQLYLQSGLLPSPTPDLQLRGGLPPFGSCGSNENRRAGDSLHTRQPCRQYDAHRQKVLRPQFFVYQRTRGLGRMAY